MTSDLLFRDQIDLRSDDSRVLIALGRTVNPADDWTPMLGPVSIAGATEFARRAGAIEDAGEHDLDLIGQVVASAAQQPTALVTNDERQLSLTHKFLDRLRGAGEYPSNKIFVLPSLEFLRRLLACGAIDVLIMETSLSSEHVDIRGRPMGDRVREKKLRRVETLARDLALEPALREATAAPDDADIREHFLNLDRHDGS